MVIPWTKPLARLISDKLAKLIENLDRNLGFIEREGKDLDWNNVLANYSVLTDWFLYNLEHKKPITNLNAVLNIYMVINRHEEELLDIPDKKSRHNKFFEYLNSHDYVPDILPYDRIQNYRQIARKLRREKEARAITTYFEVENDLREISRAIDTCACDLDGFIQEQIQFARGK